MFQLAVNGVEYRDVLSGAAAPGGPGDYDESERLNGG